MEVRNALEKFSNIASAVGRPALSLLFQRDFEFYMMALELTDSNDNLIDYFTFPVMPESITKTENQIVNVKKTMQGVTVLSTKTNPIQSISIKGDFGRSFKLMLNNQQPSVQGLAFSIDSGVYDRFGLNANSVALKRKSFINDIKTGYGALNILRSIISKSNCSDQQGNPFRLYLYNMALGESYLVSVKPEGLTLNQTKERNMVWSYNVSFDILSPLEYVRSSSDKSSAEKSLAFAALQKDLIKKIKQLANLSL